MKKAILGLTACGLIITGCGHKAQTYEYYLEHINEAVDVAKKCQTISKSEPEVAEDCENANSALAMYSYGARTSE